MRIGICSYSFHRLLAAGQMDIFRYITTCKELGCTQLDPWNAHLSDLKDGAEALHAGKNPGKSQYLSAVDENYVERVRAAADETKLQFGTMVVDGAHIYEPTAEAREANRQRAYRWISVGATLGMKQIRIDAGGPEEMPGDIFQIIVDGYRDLIDRAGSKGIEILIENHWGPSIVPENIERLMAAIPGLGLLLDTRSWKPGRRDEGCKRCARFAKATHIKTINWDTAGNEPNEDIGGAVTALKGAGYQGTWGIESVPADGDEIAGCRRAIALLKRLV